MLSVMLAVGAGCSNKEPCAEVACPSVGERAADGDYDVVLGGKQGWSTVDLSNATLASSQSFSEFSLRGGEMIFSKPVCSAPNMCLTTLKTLRFDLAPFSLGLSDGTSVAYDALSISYETPIDLEQQGTTYPVSAGTSTHGCATVNGRAWHAAAPSTLAMLLKIDDTRQLIEITGVAPLVVRTDDSACSAIALTARIKADPTLPWTLVGADGGGADGSDSNDGNANDSNAVDSDAAP